ncbi:hypothetical protein C9374_010122 [Naegleria lovaniensis]|uniref:Uncharacterized protein n=1 Tax=Naegleria lovaniensis TaxID=51637 RepID=A0AA88GHR8_NAELO|nr:uncharacterized protein C9374_010122 [Naegleria lovaniensis]KAG2375118.1 hypothetical protein C9374_010122 [Naegleria lovaniensis]
MESVDLTAQTILPHYASLNPASEDDLHKSLLEMYDDLLPKNELLEITDASKPLVNHLSNMIDGDTESNERKRKYVACTDDVLGYLKLLKQMKKFKATTPLQDVQNFKVYEVQKFDPSAFISSNPKPKTFLGTLFSSVKELNTKVSTLTSELSAANTNIANLTLELSTANTNISNLTLELSTANTNIENLTSELSTANTKIDTLTSKVRALQIARISERLDSILKNSGRESQFNVFQLSGQ